ncbi:hypothetical protein OAH18_01605 [bacterium]|nr:hypothetical protein [bacterium]
MEKLQTIIQRLKTISVSADPTQRMLVMAVPVLLAIGLFIFYQASKPAMVPLTPGDQISAAQATTKLTEAGLTKFQNRNGRLFVAADDLKTYAQAIAVNPASTPSEWEEQFSKANIFTTRDQLLAAKDIALEKRIRRTLLAVPTIKDATVTWARSERRRWGNHGGKVTATIGITPQPNSPLTSSLATSVRTAVANMIADLQPDDVAIFDQSTGQSIGHEIGPSATAALVHNQTEVFRDRIQNGLKFLPDSTVSVSAAIQAKTTSTTSQVPAIHVLIQTPDTSYQSLAASKETQQRVQTIVRQTIEPAYELGSLRVTRVRHVAAATPPTKSPQQSTWLIPLIVGVAFLIVTEMANQRTPTKPATPDNDKQSHDLVADPIASSIADTMITPQPEPIDTTQLTTALQTHPNESLTVLQRWATTSSSAAATVASQMEPSLAAQFAQKMSDDERSQLHNALQDPANSTSNATQSAISAFCEQVTRSASQPITETPPIDTPQRSLAAPVAKSRIKRAAGATKPTLKPKSRLYEFPPRLVAQLLESEKPQTVAIAIAQLDEKTIGKVLRNFSLAQSDRVRQRLPQVNSVAPAIRTGVESAVLSRIESHAKQQAAKESA